MNNPFLQRFYSNVYVSNAAWLMGERVIRLLVMAAVGVLVARYLGPDRFGLLAYAQSYLALFIIMGKLGLDGIVTRELVKNPQDQAQIMGSAFLLKIIGSGFVLLFVAVSIAVFDIPNPDGILITVLAVGVLFQSISVIDFYFQSRVESKYVARAQLIQLFMSSILKLWLIFIQSELVWFAVAIALGDMFLATALFFFYRQQGGRITSWRTRTSMVRQLIGSSLPLVLYAFCVVGVMNIDQVMIKVLRNETEVGWYAAAAMISTVWYFIPVALGSTFNPYIIRHGDRGILNSDIRLLFSTLTVITIAGALIVLFLAPMLVNSIFGEEYAPAAGILVVHILNGVFVYHVSIRSRVLLAMDKQQLSTVIMLIALVLNVLGNFIVIPKYGAVGAAWASVVAWGTSVLIVPLFFSDTRQFVKIFLKPRLIGIVGLFHDFKS